MITCGRRHNGTARKCCGTGKGIVFLARWPTSKAMQHDRDRIRELTERRRTLLRVEVIVEDVNRFLRGWAAYFRYGNSARHFDKIMGYARMRLAGIIAKRHRRSRGFGWMVITYLSPDYLGLINLDGWIASGVQFAASVT